MLELINNYPALIGLIAFLPALVINLLVYFFLNKNWQNKYNELEVFYNQSQRDNKIVREELLLERENLKTTKADNDSLKSKIVELETEIEEEIRDKNEKLSQFEVRLDDLEKELSVEKLKNLPENLQKERENKTLKEKSIFDPSKEVTQTVQKAGDTIKERLTGFFKRITNPDGKV